MTPKNDTTSIAAPAALGDRQVRLGYMAPNGISASMYGLVALGTTKRPQLAQDLRGSVELRFREAFAPVRMNFASDEILVEDSQEENGWRPELVISGSLPDIVKLTAAPFFGGLPKLTDSEGAPRLPACSAGR